MIAQHGITADFDGKNGCQLLKPGTNPLLAVIVVYSGDRIDAAKKSPSYTSRDTVINAQFVISDDFVSGVPPHAQPRLPCAVPFAVINLCTCLYLWREAATAQRDLQLGTFPSKINPVDLFHTPFPLGFAPPFKLGGITGDVIL